MTPWEKAQREWVDAESAFLRQADPTMCVHFWRARPEQVAYVAGLFPEGLRSRVIGETAEQVRARIGFRP